MFRTAELSPIEVDTSPLLEGDLVIGEEVFGAGDYIRSLSDSGHAPYTEGGCRFFFHTSLDDEYPEVQSYALSRQVRTIDVERFRQC